MTVACLLKRNNAIQFVLYFPFSGLTWEYIIISEINAHKAFYQMIQKRVLGEYQCIQSYKIFFCIVSGEYCR